MKPANYAPVYCALYPQLAELTRSFGYALSIHGSMAKDFDLVCIPWADSVREPKDVVESITSQFDIRVVGKPEIKNHGRLVYTISIGHGECAIDLSFMNPQLTAAMELVDRLDGQLTEMSRPSNWDTTQTDNYGNQA